MIPIGREPPRGEPHDQHADGHDQRGTSHRQHLVGVDRYVAHRVHHVAGQRGDGDVKQKPHRHVVGAEVDAHHGPDLEVDEQEEDVGDGGVALVQQANEGHRRGPHRGGTDGKKGQVVEHRCQGVASSVGRLH